MIRFDYQEPTTLKKALSLMEKHGDDGRVIAGGTALLIMMRQRLLTPKVVISLARIPKFDKITFNSKDGLCVVPARAIATSSSLPPCKSTILCSMKRFVKSPSRAFATWEPSAAISPAAIRSPIRAQA